MSTHHVSDQEQERVLQFAADFAATLGLDGAWTFAIGLDPPDDDDAWASILVTYQRWHATIFLCPEWMDLREKDRAQCIAHEVLHVLHRDIDHLVYEVLPNINPGTQAAEQAWQQQYKYEMEKIVDRLAWAWYNATGMQQRYDELDPERQSKPKRKARAR